MRKPGLSVFLLISTASSLALWLGLSSHAAIEKPSYPAHWWRVVPREEARAWEVLPQDAGPGEVIISSRNELGILNAEASTPFVYHGRRYASLEGFRSSLLYPEIRVNGAPDPRIAKARAAGLSWPHTREEVTQMNSTAASRAGLDGEKMMAKLGIGWVSFEGRSFQYRTQKPGQHYRLIVDAVRTKLMQNQDALKVLKSTGALILRPEFPIEKAEPSEWRLHEVYMRLRSEIAG